MNVFKEDYYVTTEITDVSQNDRGQSISGTLFLHFYLHVLNFLFVGLPIFASIPPLLVTPKEFSTLRQTCQAVGFPPPVLSWTRLGMPLPVNKTEVKDGSLTIKTLIPADSGLYECVATNRMGTKKAKMNVVVQKEPSKGLSFFQAPRGINKLRRLYCCLATKHDCKLLNAKLSQ